MKPKIVVAYVPGLHEGYIRFFRKHGSAEALYIFGRDIIKDFRPLVKDIRAMEPEDVKRAIESLEIFPKVLILDPDSLLSIISSDYLVVMPSENECREFAGSKMPLCSIVFDPVFLRWDKDQSLACSAPVANHGISEKEINAWVMDLAAAQSAKSSDWWRQIGAALVCGENIFLAFNRPSLNDHIHHLFGDPRSNFKKGVHFELSLFDHAEMSLIAKAARLGVPVEGARLYVTTFPCPSCAKLVAKSGVKKLYYRDGYSVLDGEDVLKQNGVEIVRII